MFLVFYVEQLKFGFRFSCTRIGLLINTFFSLKKEKKGIIRRIILSSDTIIIPSGLLRG